MERCHKTAIPAEGQKEDIPNERKLQERRKGAAAPHCYRPTLRGTAQHAQICDLAKPRSKVSTSVQAATAGSLDGPAP